MATDLFPDTQLIDPHDERSIAILMRILEDRMQKKDLSLANMHEKQDNFRDMLVRLDRENIFLRTENSSLKIFSEQQTKTISSLEAHISKMECQINNLLYKLNSANNALKNLQQELKNRDTRLGRVIDSQKIIQMCNNKIQMATDEMAKELNAKLREQYEQLEDCIKKKDNKLNLIKQILTCEHASASDNTVQIASTSSNPGIKIAEKSIPVTVGGKHSAMKTNNLPVLSKSKITPVDTIKSKLAVNTRKIESNRLNGRDKSNQSKILTIAKRR